MSANGMPSELTGAFIEVAKVSNLGQTGETETIVGETSDEIDIEPDIDRAEANKHSQRRKLSKPTYAAINLSCSALLVPGADVLEEMGVVDSNGDEVYGQAWEACRIHVYDQDGDTDPAQSFEFEQMEWNLNQIALPEDMSTIDFDGYVHGAWRRGTTPTA